MLIRDPDEQDYVQICQARGRDPDEWQGAGVSLKVPVYHELNCDEFIDVMALLTKEEDHIAQARQIFQRWAFHLTHL